MALSDAVQNARLPVQRITWRRRGGSGNPQNLSGTTLSGIIIEPNTETIRPITGTLAIVGAGTSGEFDWSYSAADVALAGSFRVQFTATYPDLRRANTFVTVWTVYRDEGVQ